MTDEIKSVDELVGLIDRAEATSRARGYDLHITTIRACAVSGCGLHPVEAIVGHVCGQSVPPFVVLLCQEHRDELRAVGARRVEQVQLRVAAMERAMGRGDDA